MKEPDVEALKARIGWKQLVKWAAFYKIEPWGQDWLRTGRSTEIIRSAMAGGFDKHNEERFLLTYQPGDEYRPKVRRSEQEIRAKLATIPGLKKRDPSCRQSGKSRRSSRPRPEG